MNYLHQKLILLVAACFLYSGLLKCASWLREGRGKHLIILNYHRAVGGDLRRHLLYLRRHYRIMPLEEALEELYTPHHQTHMRDHSRLRTPAVLTFDDGYRDNYIYASALAQELHIPITIFLVPAYIESRNCFWWLAGDHLLRHAQVDQVIIDGQCYRLVVQQEREALLRLIDTRARYASSVAEREAFLTSIHHALAPSSSLTYQESLAFPLTWHEVRAMQISGWVSFGAHTMNHPVLAYLTDPEEVRYEISACRRVLEQQLGHPVQVFAYPLGREEHIGEQARGLVREAGYKWGLTTIQGINTPDIKPYELRRIEANVKHHWFIMAAQTAGVWQVFLSVYHQLSLSRNLGPLYKRMLYHFQNQRRKRPGE
ncbi:MAG: hypothetical protein NVSMB27_20920 [Ktedonobacteraceae bacterium]